MATTTTRLGLRKPVTSDFVDVAADLDANWDKVDANIGAVICTIATKPATPFAGQIIWVTDNPTGLRQEIWDGSAWKTFYDGIEVAQLRNVNAFAIANAAFTVIPFDAEDFDKFGGHDNVTNNTRYTVKKDGKYRISGGPSFAANAVGGRGGVWLKNNAQINGGQTMYPVSAAGLNAIICMRPVIVQCVITDYLEMAAYQNTGGNLNTIVTGSDQPCMLVEYLGP